MSPWISYVVLLELLILNNSILLGYSRKYRSVVYNKKLDSQGNEVEMGGIGSSGDFIWYTQTVAAGDTAVLHCSFDAIFAQLRNGNIDWARDRSTKDPNIEPMMIAEGKKIFIEDRRYRVYRPHNSALSVLIIRRAKKRDAGIYRCNLAGSRTRHKFMALNVTESKIDAQTSPPELTTSIGKDLIMWCNATGYPKPVVYWTREDRNRKLQDGNYQYWGPGLHLYHPTEDDTGTYSCYLDNFVQPVVSYKFSVSVEDNPWEVDGYKMRFDSTQWMPAAHLEPAPVKGMSYLLMCETRGTPKPLPKIKWLRDGRPVTNTKHFYIIEGTPDWENGYASSTLVIMRFVPRFQGNYTCVGSNAFRVKSQTFYVNSYHDEPQDTPLSNDLSAKEPINLANILDASFDGVNTDLDNVERGSTTDRENKGKKINKPILIHPLININVGDDEDFNESSGDHYDESFSNEDDRD